jgi:hypothetical protein
MILDLSAASGKYPPGTVVNIDTIEQLLDLVTKEKCNIIVSAGYEAREGEKVGPSLQVYDDYIE